MKASLAGQAAEEAFCIVERAGVRFAVPVADVRRVLGRRRVRPIPRAPAPIVGLVDDGEQPVLVLRIDHWLTAPPPLSDAPAALVVLRGSQPPIAVAVDRLCGVALLPYLVDASSARASTGAIAAPIVAEYRRGEHGVVPVLALNGLIESVTGQVVADDDDDTGR